MALLKSGNSGSVSVGTGSTRLLPAFGGRQYLLLVNDSNAKIYVSFGEAAEVGKGIPLLANGGAIEVTENNLLVGEVFAICSVAAQSISYFYV